MWKHKQANVDVTILKMFYSSVVLSVMTYCVSLFYEALYYSDKSKLNRICSIAQRIMGSNISLDNLSSYYNDRLVGKGMEMFKDSTHPLHHRYDLLPSGCDLSIPRSISSI